MAKAKKSEAKSEPGHKPAAKKAPAKAKESTATSHKPPAAAKSVSSSSHSAGAAKKPEKSAKSSKSSSASSIPSGAPLIDTGLAAQTAAAMVASKFAGGAGAGQKSSESSAFKNLKESLSKPSLGGLGGILGTGGGEKKFTPNFGGNKGGPGGGRNQTFGADVTRTGVPRRTNG